MKKKERTKKNMSGTIAVLPGIWDVRTKANDSGGAPSLTV